MKKNILNKLLLVVLMFSLGCKAKKDIVKASPDKNISRKELTKAELIKTISNKQLDFSTLQMKANANLSINNKGNEASMNIRIKKDEAIWVRVTVIAGLEVARALITPDSVKIVNRVEGTYLAKPFSYLNNYANEQISFSVLQALLIGNTVPGFITEDSEVQLQNNLFTLSGLLKGLGYTVNYNQNTKVIQTDLVDEDMGQKLSASYSDFYLVSDHAVPHSVKIISAANRKNVNLELKFTQVTMNESLSFPFSVPKQFTEIN